MDEAVEDLPAISLLGRQADLTAAFNCAEHHRLISSPTLPDVPPVPADVCLVNFHGPLERSRIRFFHRLTDAMTEIPSRLVGDSEGPLELIGRDSLPRLAHQIDGRKPLRKRQVRIVEDASGGNAELVAA